MSIYLSLKGQQGDVTGDVTEKNHQGWIELNSAEFGGVTHRANMITGKPTHTVNGKPSFSEFTLTKSLDASSTLLFEYAHRGEVFPKVTLHYVSAGDPGICYFEIQLDNVFITHFNQVHSGNQTHPQEQFTLSYSAIEKKYLGTDPKATPVPSGYNISTASSQ